MYHFWRQNPLFRPALAFAVGIILHDQFKLSFIWLLVLMPLLLFQVWWQKKEASKRVNSVIPFVFIVLGAVFHSLQPTPSNIDLTASHAYLVQVDSEMRIKGETSSCMAKILHYDSAGIPVPLPSIRIKLAFRHDEKANKLLPGDQIFCFGKAQRINPSLNPSTFDYAAYMTRQGVFHQIRVDSSSWKLHLQQNSMQRLAIIWRNKALAIFDSTLKNTENKAIIKALICGYTQELVPEIRDVYVKSGTMHMLSVSGMHVGILLILLGKSLFWIRNTLIKNLFLVILLWLYALLTGLSPSVMRAVSMGTFFLIGESMKKQHSSWNSVAFALLVLLLWDTHFLFNAGFQLSFLALCGILLVSNLYQSRPKHWKEKVKNWLGSYFAVSMAAQLATAPIAIYYFDQFPIYFLIGNLLLVPLAAPMMYGGFLLLLVYQIPILGPFSAWVLEIILGLCQSFAGGIAHLPGASLNELNWDFLLVIAAYWFLIALVLKLKIQQNTGLILSMMVFCIWACFSGFTRFQEQKQCGLIIYSMNRKQACDIYSGNHYFYFGDSLEKNEIAYSIQPFRNKRNLKKELEYPIERYNWGSSLCVDSLRVIRFWGKGDFELPSSALPSILILEKEAFCNGQSLLDSSNFCNIVLAGNLSWKSRKYWQKEAEKRNISVHDVRMDGAFQKELWNYSFGMK